MIVLYSARDNKIQWKLTDFGYSSHVGMASPSPIRYWKVPRNYLAPEVLIAVCSDTKSDIWSAGCILYEIATGLPAFDNDEAIRKFAWLRIAPPLVSKSRSDLTLEVDDVVERTLQTTASLRPDATTLVKDVAEKIKLDQPIIEITKQDIKRCNEYDDTLGANRFLGRLEGNAGTIIVESHALRETTDCRDRIYQLARLLVSLHKTSKSSILSCLAFAYDADVEYSLIFRAPQSILGPETSIYSLETVLSSPSHPAHQALQLISQKARVAAILAWSINAIHNAGFSYKSVGAHNILIDASPDPRPYLMGFDIDRIQPLTKLAKQIVFSAEWRDQLYQHPDCFDEDIYTFRREYDFYSFGVVMLELARMVSFAQLPEDWKKELETMNGERLQWFRLQRARELTDTVGEEYVRIMSLCLTGELGQGADDEVGKRFEEDVCMALDRLAVTNQ